LLLAVVKDDAERVACAGAQAADTVSHVHAVNASAAAYWTVAHRENDADSLLEWNDFDPRLHARTLLGEHELSAGEVASGRR
jgi:hypothetical protein